MPENLVRKFALSAVTSDVISQLGLVDLMKGYGVEEGDYNDRAADEYAVGKNPSYAFLDVRNGRARGSLVVRQWNQENEFRGRPFWHTLTDLDPQTAQAATAIGPNAYFIGGIVISPDSRREGIATSLLTHAFGDERPPFIFGSTNNPGQIMVRTRALGNQGYDTYYGPYRIDTETFAATETDEHMPVVEAFLYAFEKQKIDFTSTFLPSRVPQTDGFPDGIATVLRPVQERQRQITQPLAAVRPLVSVRSSLRRGA